MRDQDGEIRQKKSDTKIRNTNKEFGEYFAKGCRGQCNAVLVSMAVMRVPTTGTPLSLSQRKIILLIHAGICSLDDLNFLNS